MNNDLISREALKEEFLKYKPYAVDFLSLIDNAPTVEERPQGEWITVKDTYQWATYIYWDCPFCKSRYGKASNFCSNCGARLTGGDNNDVQ